MVARLALNQETVVRFHRPVPLALCSALKVGTLPPLVFLLSQRKSPPPLSYAAVVQLAEHQTFNLDYVGFESHLRHHCGQRRPL